ncbi:MAG: shikimate dehydrogenase [Anaerolineales bacterium]
MNYSFGLTGFPLTHSRSPELHAEFLRAAGLTGAYRLYPAQADELPALLARLRTGELHGLNVTIPHKQAVIALLDELTPTAGAMGAVNTVYRRGDKLIGENTDAPGFWDSLPESVRAHTGSALILGAGGSARAVVYALAARGWQVSITARRAAQAENLCAAMQPHLPISLRVLDWELRAAPLDLPDLLVNCTPLGMYPHPQECPLPEGATLPKTAHVYDLIYNPEETRLLARAKAQGLTYQNGWRMLVEQARRAFNQWVVVVDSGCG